MSPETCNHCDGPLQPATDTVTPALACTGCGRQIPAEPGVTRQAVWIDRMEHVDRRKDDTGFTKDGLI